MSYPSAAGLLQAKGLTIANATPEQLQDVLWEAFHTHLPLGVNYLEAFANRVKTTGQRVLQVEDPNTDLGRQLARLLGTDIARPVCEAKLGIALGLYNCCAPVGAPDHAGLRMTMQEQITLQTSANC